MEAMLQATLLTAAEAFAATVAAGGATYEDIANNGGSAANIWSILAGLGSIIPKVIFNPAAGQVWLEIAGAIVGDEAAEQVASTRSR